LRRLNQVVSQLPITSKETYEHHAFSEYSDIATINLLASVTKGFEMLSELKDDFKLLQSKGNSEYGIGDNGGGMGFGGMDGVDQMMEMYEMANHSRQSKMMFNMNRGGQFR
jgi:hypothetical protein